MGFGFSERSRRLSAGLSSSAGSSSAASTAGARHTPNPAPATAIAAVTAVAAAALASSLGCVNTPEYLGPQQALEVGIADPNDPDGGEINEALGQLILPIAIESDQDADARAARAAELGVDVSYVKLEDVEITIEWTIKNLSENDATAFIHVNGANERFIYIPELFRVDPEDDEQPPPLLGNVPITVPAGATITGVFREDQLREAAIDLELITRGLINPYAAILENHSELTEFPDETGQVVPRSTFAHLVQYDFIFRGNEHLVFEYDFRIRDPNELLHPLLLGAPEGEFTEFMPVEYVPPPPPEDEAALR